MKVLKYFLFALLLIVIDQASKLCINHYMVINETYTLIGDWFKLHYVTNPGMAFGIEIEHLYGKLFLTFFRLFAMVFISWYIVELSRQRAPKGLLWAMSMILAGAIGNVVDSTFYGVYLHNAPPRVLTPWFHGQVIDMIFFDLWEGYLPDWLPFWGGDWFSMPIFNLADSFIFIGVCIILIFQGTFFPKLEEEETVESEANDATEEEVVEESETPKDVIEPNEAAETPTEIADKKEDF